MNIHVLVSGTGGYGVDVCGVSLIEPDPTKRMYYTYSIPLLDNISDAVSCLEVVKRSLEKLVNGEVTREQWIIATPNILLNTINNVLDKCSDL